MSLARSLSGSVALSIILCLGAGPLRAQTPTAPTSFVWYEGDIRHEVHVQPGLVAEFGGTAAASAGMQKLSGTSLVKKSGKTRIYRLSADALQKTARAGLSAGQSPVFSDSPEGGVLRALPGGVIVTFRDSHDEAWIRAWAEQHGLEFDQILPSVKANMAALKSPSGVAAIELANRIRTLPDVSSAEPNWWTEKWKSSTLTRSITPAQEKKIRSMRESASQRFSEP